MTIRTVPVAGALPLKMLRPLDGINAVDRLAKRLAGIQWLRPNGHNLDAMLEILDWVLERNLRCAEFMLHSSELMPGGSPTFPTAEHIETLYQHLEILFDRASARFRGRTMTQFYHDYARRNIA